tara:strand:+ start:281 stop:547 length:267 start_codon:yes stop_codon:yes gene_type:complete
MPTPSTDHLLSESEHRVMLFLNVYLWPILSLMAKFSLKFHLISSHKVVTRLRAILLPNHYSNSNMQASLKVGLRLLGLTSDNHSSSNI